MTQIKLRRDTAANFTSKNPILGVGEPAYETDTKKLKIGDGTTDYNSLDYFTSGGGGSTNISATLPLKIVDGVISLEVDGQTIQIVDGKLHANLDELGNEVNTLAGDIAGVQADLLNKQDKSTAVTIDTDQDITGAKSLTAGLTTFKNTDNIRKVLGEINGNGHYCHYYISRDSGEKPCYLGKVSQNAFNMGIPGLTGVTGRIFANTLTKYNGSDEIGTILSTDILGSYVDGTTITYTGGKLTASSTAPTNVVTTDTAQTISGDKEFTGITTISNDIKIPIGKRITTPDGQHLIRFWTSFIGLGTSIRPLMTYDGSNYYLHDKSVIAGDGIKITELGYGEIQISSTIGNMAAYVTEEFVDGTEGYRVWSNGRCEQWGSFVGPKSITFLKNYADTNYILLAYVTLKTSSEPYNGVFGTEKRTTGFTAGGFAGTTEDAYIIKTCGTVNWYTSGVLAP